MNSDRRYVLLYLFSVLVSSVSQIILKKSANVEHGSVLREYLNPRVIGAYALFFLSSFCTMLAYRGVPLSLGPVLETTGYIWVTLLGLLCLGEKVNGKKWMGLGLIVAGILVFSI